jgi:hypothetical protein
VNPRAGSRWLFAFAPLGELALNPPLGRLALRCGTMVILALCLWRDRNCFMVGLEYCMRKRPLPANAEVAIRGQLRDIDADFGMALIYRTAKP